MKVADPGLRSLPYSQPPGLAIVRANALIMGEIQRMSAYARAKASTRKILQAVAILILAAFALSMMHGELVAQERNTADFVDCFALHGSDEARVVVCLIQQNSASQLNIYEQNQQFSPPRYKELIDLTRTLLEDQERTKREHKERKKASKIDEYLKKAQQAFSKGRLTTPEKTSAWFYYRKMLDLDPDNNEAMSGSDAIAGRFAERIRAALDGLDDRQINDDERKQRFVIAERLVGNADRFYREALELGTLTKTQDGSEDTPGRYARIAGAALDAGDRERARRLIDLAGDAGLGADLIDPLRERLVKAEVKASKERLRSLPDDLSKATASLVDEFSKYDLGTFDEEASPFAFPFAGLGECTWLERSDSACVRCLLDIKEDKRRREIDLSVKRTRLVSEPEFDPDGPDKYLMSCDDIGKLPDACGYAFTAESATRARQFTVTFYTEWHDFDFYLDSTLTFRTEVQSSEELATDASRG